MTKAIARLSGPWCARGIALAERAIHRLEPSWWNAWARSRPAMAVMTAMVFVAEAWTQQGPI
jgi:hypothetical protein